MKSYNKLQIDVFSSGTSRIDDPTKELDKASGIRFMTLYPGGLYGAASFYVARDIIEWWQVSGAKRLIFRNGQKIVYEGEIDDLQSALSQTGQGIKVTATGYWGSLLMRRRWGKHWADDRITNAVWVWDETASGAELCTVDRNNRIRFTPKAEAWPNNTGAVVTYTMPTGETIKKVKYDYDFAESAGVNDWELGWWDATNGFVSIASATGAAANQTYTPAAPDQSISLQYFSRDAQTPSWDGTYYGEVSNVVVYGNEAPAHAVDLTQIAKDIEGKLSGEGVMNSDEDHIDAITYADEIIPFISEYDTIANILMRAAKFGDDTQNSWAVGVYDSEKAATPNGTSVLFCEQYLALTDFDYVIRLDEPNVAATISFTEDFGEIWNWVCVQYTNILGERKFITPDDQATLKDTTSISDYRQRDYLLNVGQSDSDTALDNGVRFLAEYKDPKWNLTAPIRVKGSIRDSNNQKLPVSHVKAGKRIKIENFLRDTSGAAGDGLTFRISKTRYTDSNEIVTISAGKPDELIFPRYIPPPTSRKSSLHKHQEKVDYLEDYIQNCYYPEKG